LLTEELKTRVIDEWCSLISRSLMPLSACRFVSGWFL